MILDLSAEEKDAILRLGSNSDHEIIIQDVLESLVKKRILCYTTSKKHLDLTDLGQDIYDNLAKEQR